MEKIKFHVEDNGIGFLTLSSKPVNALSIDFLDQLEEVIKSLKEDTSEFRLKYDPNHPAANKEGFVEMPNVNALVEMMDMREAQRSYEANLNMIEASKNMISKTIGLLR